MPQDTLVHFQRKSIVHESIRLPLKRLFLKERIGSLMGANSVFKSTLGMNYIPENPAGVASL